MPWLAWLLSLWLGWGWIAGTALLVIYPCFLKQGLRVGRGASAEQRVKVLLLVAHPDDECMFFGPTLLSLAMDPAVEPRVVSVSNGNADGLGEMRTSEMTSACSVLNVPAVNVQVLDHPALQDGHKQDWDQKLLVDIIRRAVESERINIVITFDGYGVSGHPNHCALSRALRAFLLGWKMESIQRGVERPPLQAWELISINILRKYSGIMEIWWSTVSWLICRKWSNVHCFVTPSPHQSIQAMKQHQSQWVWFRKLFVVFAAYTYVNTLRKIDC